MLTKLSLILDYFPCRELNEEQKRKFLLFLTGSDRIPARGMESISMTIQVFFLPYVKRDWKLQKDISWIVREGWAGERVGILQNIKNIDLAATLYPIILLSNGMSVSVCVFFFSPKQQTLISSNFEGWLSLECRWF